MTIFSDRSQSWSRSPVREMSQSSPRASWKVPLTTLYTESTEVYSHGLAHKMSRAHPASQRDEPRERRGLASESVRNDDEVLLRDRSRLLAHLVAVVTMLVVGVAF